MASTFVTWAKPAFVVCTMIHRCWSRGARQLFFFGTRLPFLRALERPIAIACLRLFTLPPLPPRPLFAVPFLYRRISLSTSRFELRAYFVFFFFFAAIVILYPLSSILYPLSSIL